MATALNRIALLFQKYADRTATPEETRELFALADAGSFDEEFNELLLARLNDTEFAEDFDRGLWEGVLNKVKDDIDAIENPGVVVPVPVVKVRRFGYAWLAAAVAVIVVGVGFYFYFNKARNQVKDSVAGVNDVLPGKQGATLTLSNGRKIRLSDVGNGELAREAGVEITKTADGRVVYTVRHGEGGTTEGGGEVGSGSLPGVEMTGRGDMTKGGAMTGQSGVNTIATANGETYLLVLPDQTKVWLNSASSLTYSAQLGRAGKRLVKLQGEAYFEVFKDKRHPFVVESKGQQVEVLGTHFNVNSYADEPDTKTTLLEGSVRISVGQGSMVSKPSLPSASLPEGERMGVVLRPGEQAVNNKGRLVVKKADVESVMDWKEGDFNLENLDLGVAMRKISRWYDVEVVYDPSVDQRIKAWGLVSRNRKLSEVLAAMESSSIAHFKIKGRIVYVSK